MSTHSLDYLTDCLLRDSFEERINKLIEIAKIGSRTFSLAIIDVDRFKHFNDKFGHVFGDRVLKYMAKTLRLVAGEDGNNVFRYGGDEFVILFPDKNAKEVLAIMKQCALIMKKEPFFYSGMPYKITFSGGIADFTDVGDNRDKIVNRADSAMYFVKRHGRNNILMADNLPYFRSLYFFLAIVVSVIVLGLMGFFITLKVRQAIKGVNPVPIIAKISFKQKGNEQPGSTDNIPHIYNYVPGDPYEAKILLENGMVLEGSVIKETEDGVLFRFSYEQGQGEKVFQKDKIQSIVKEN